MLSALENASPVFLPDITPYTQSWKRLAQELVLSALLYWVNSQLACCSLGCKVLFIPLRWCHSSGKWNNHGRESDPVCGFVLYMWHASTAALTSDTIQALLTSHFHKGNTFLYLKKRATCPNLNPSSVHLPVCWVFEVQTCQTFPIFIIAIAKPQTWALPYDGVAHIQIFPLTLIFNLTSCEVLT